jgi:hypothetical protein
VATAVVPNNAPAVLAPKAAEPDRAAAPAGEPNEAQPSAAAVMPNNAPTGFAPTAAEPDREPGDLPAAAVEPNEAQPAQPAAALVVPNKMLLHLPPPLKQIGQRPNSHPERLSRLRHQELRSREPIFQTDFKSLV